MVVAKEAVHLVRTTMWSRDDQVKNAFLLKYLKVAHVVIKLVEPRWHSKRFEYANSPSRRTCKESIRNTAGGINGKRETSGYRNLYHSYTTTHSAAAFCIGSPNLGPEYAAIIFGMSNASSV